MSTQQHNSKTNMEMLEKQKSNSWPPVGLTKDNLFKGWLLTFLYSGTIDDCLHLQKW